MFESAVSTAWCLRFRTDECVGKKAFFFLLGPSLWDEARRKYRLIEDDIGEVCANERRATQGVMCELRIRKYALAQICVVESGAGDFGTLEICFLQDRIRELCTSNFGSTESAVRKFGQSKTSSCQIGVRKIASLHVRVGKVGMRSLYVTQNASFQLAARKCSPTNRSAGEICTRQIAFREISFHQAGKSERGISHLTAPQRRAVQHGSIKDGVCQIVPTFPQREAQQVGSLKVRFPIGVMLELLIAKIRQCSHCSGNITAYKSGGAMLPFTRWLNSIEPVDIDLKVDRLITYLRAQQILNRKIVPIFVENDQFSQDKYPCFSPRNLIGIKKLGCSCVTICILASFRQICLTRGGTGSVPRKPKTQWSDCEPTEVAQYRCKSTSLTCPEGHFRHAAPLKTPLIAYEVDQSQHQDYTKGDESGFRPVGVAHGQVLDSNLRNPENDNNVRLATSGCIHPPSFREVA